ncbi:MAG: beta-N-acetylglucosaminidase domain-containing protein [Clostridia bacterium]|nr:beta-N-acetylglucosaminidase domain-containing protein [Clostridia bacterium]
MIYPVPQKNNLNGNIIEIDSIKLSGDYTEKAEKILASYDIDVSDNGFNVEIKFVNSRKTTYIEEICKLCNEKYFITADENKVLIEAATKRGAFRAVNTLAKLINKNELKTGVLEDYPLFAKRGYIEGFYGDTWEQSKRLSVMSLMAKYGMNTFYYAPKDDDYHREKWRELYPEKELGELKNLFDYATENELDFCWSIGPGLTYKYTSEEDFDLLINKIRNVYSIGVRNFGLLLDDIPADFQYEEDSKAFDSTVDAHIYLVNKTYNALKDFDSSINLTVCPTQYFGDENGYYISKFGSSIPADVSLFWTGAEICSRVQTVREADSFMRSTCHKPLYWDNFPVNDAEMFQEMHIGALIGRDKDLYKHCEGIISNVMEYAECSKIPLMTIADYLWNPDAYNSDKSLDNAHDEMLGENKDLFFYFAEHLGVSCLNRHASAFMSETFEKINFQRAIGEKEKSLENFRNYIAKCRECLNLISDTSVPLFEEMQKWVKKFSMCCDLMDAIYAVQENPDEEKKAYLADLLRKYNSDAVVLTGFCLRENAEKTLK